MSAQRLVLRRARAADADLLLQWRNEPSTRRWFLDATRVRRADHLAWFERTLAGNRSRLYIAEVGRRPVGQLRLDRRSAAVAEVSFSVDRTFRGRGLGVELLRRAAAACRRDLGASRLTARVLTGNVASAVTFLKAGYQFTRVDSPAARPTYVFERRLAS